ncbi:uncharacterized protein LOC108414602 [Pygocentrus nattereri]|uniref:uncharacterized protein LOC108414602 n=1 Tax=Pygocentrus nattereri TaxID=42514 RepID=UPI0018912AD8|nr:uncharacterized protein LOC108414602 [Pygocentrus nattereri]XP_037387223.1 uncharacterized protein LOC108414602 [Pygocentrus nattereri]
MQSCSSALCVLILLISTLTTGSESAFPPVTVKLHDSITLSCSDRCSGLVRWTVSHKSTDPLAECNQSSCRSVKEGYQMIHDQYLKGDFSLNITDADFTKRGWYTCQCDDKDLCDVKLQIERLNSTVQKKPGESLVLDLDVSDAVKVLYIGTGAANRSSGQICTVDRCSLDCKPEYKERVSAALRLSGMKPSDSGVYTTMATRNEEVFRSYSVTVQDDLPCRDTGEGAAVPAWICVLIAVLVAGIVILAVKIVQLKRENQKLRNRHS